MSELVFLCFGGFLFLCALTVSAMVNLITSLQQQGPPPENTPIDKMTIVAKVLASGFYFLGTSISATLMFGVAMAVLVALVLQKTP